jgi:hypothetical protein
VKLELDLPEIYSRGRDNDKTLCEAMAEAAANEAPIIEFIPGTGFGQLKKHVLRLLDQPEIKAEEPVFMPAESKKWHQIQKIAIKVIRSRPYVNPFWEGP